ncbi:MAG: hypothetical protein ABIO46_15370 [Chitinophagales bacterium]
MEINDENVDLKTMSSCIDRLVEKGFIENFMVNENGLTAVSTQVIYSPDKVKVLNFYRFEGESDPDDSAILYAIETSDGIRGTLTDAFGTYADDDVQKFMSNVEEISKKALKPKQE